MVPGLTGKSEMIVKEEDLVSQLGFVSLEILSTPRLVQLLEASAIDAIQEYMAQDQLSLGTLIKVQHFAPTPLGMKVIAHALLNRVEDNHLFFLVTAYDEKGKVAEGEHERILVSRDKFLRKIEEKRSR